MRVGFIAEGTTCNSCGTIIKQQALKVEGVKNVTFDLATETGHIEFDETKTDIDTILFSIEEKGYTCYVLDDNAPRRTSRAGWIFAAVGAVIVGYFIFMFAEGIAVPHITESMGLGLLFVVGLLTGFHCVGMCGGFVVSYSAKCAQQKKSPHKAHAAYAVGKILSYTLIGSVFGLVGSIIAFTPLMRGIAGVIAGIFLVLFGLRMLGVFRGFGIKMPGVVGRFVAKHHDANPLVVGLLNGLMIACGPLQAIYIMAAGTGSMIEGAKLLFVFALGTLPVMIGFGYFTSMVSSKLTSKILKWSGALIIVLGIMMMNNGMALTGTGYDASSIVTASQADELSTEPLTISAGYQEIRMNVTRNGWEPDRFVLQKDVPVRWIIDGQEITSCNNAIQVPKIGLEFDVKEGEQVIEFTPTEEGVLPWSCWMGMIPGTFVVMDGNVTQAEVDKTLADLPAPVARGCGCGSH